jgi:glutathione S-transferase
MVLKELGVAHELRWVDRAGGALSTASYRRLHPLGKIPVMESPDGPIFEAAAILLYLADRHPAANLAPAPNSAERAAFLKWLFFLSSNVHPTLLSFFYPERIAGENGAPAVLAHAHAHMMVLLTALDLMVLQEKPAWFSPDRPGILGYYTGMLMRWLASFGDGHPSYFRSHEFPGLHRVLLPLENRAAARSVALHEKLGPTIFTNPQF